MLHCNEFDALAYADNFRMRHLGVESHRHGSARDRTMSGDLLADSAHGGEKLIFDERNGLLAAGRHEPLMRPSARRKLVVALLRSVC